MRVKIKAITRVLHLECGHEVTVEIWQPYEVGHKFDCRYCSRVRTLEEHGDEET